MTTAATPPDESRTLIDALLDDQRTLTAVERFARWHDETAVTEPAYRRLLPATAPNAGQQYAFEVDLDKCSGCKACVTACHSLNGLDENETWRKVGLLVGDPADDFRARRGAAAFQQHVTTACHHCIDPGCLNGCPVLAYDKDPLTGIVCHLDDQCIGCQYCVMMCPYEVPQYSKARGIVRKCDMCHSRLAVGEAPACVQACPTSAIRITVVEQSKVRGKYRRPSELSFPSTVIKRLVNNFLPASPNPAITLPTTRFVTQRTLPENLYAGDHSIVCRSESHLPLVVLLVLSQLAVGASVAALIIQPALVLLLVALIISVAAMVAGSLHLGRPLKAWRSFLGWRKSWFSREVIALGAFALLVALATGALLLPVTQSFGKVLAWFAAFAGLFTVTCSAMIYVDTQREFWNASRSFAKFFGTTLLLGAVTTLVTLGFVSANIFMFSTTTATLVLVTLAKLAFECRIFAQLVDEETSGQTPLNKTARLLAGELNIFVRFRIACGVMGGVLLPLVTLLQIRMGGKAGPALAIAALALCVVGELIERYLFFTAVVTQRMPGGVAS